MNVMFLIWLAVAIALLYFMGWNLVILFRQKKAWKAFSEEKGLRYDSPRLTDSPEMSGPVDGYTISFFTGEHLSADQKSTRKLTAIEVQLASKVPFEGGVGSGNMAQFVRDLGFTEQAQIENEQWRSDYIAASKTPYALSAYLTQKRVDALMRLIKVKNAWVILVFRGDMALLRFDTPDPLDSPKKLKAIAKRMVEAAEVLELEPGEISALRKEMERVSPKDKPLDVKDEDLKATTSLSLEDEEPEDQASSPEPENQTEKPD